MAESRNRKFLSYTPALCWGFLIAYLTLLPKDQIPRELADLNDKLIHAGIFFFNAFLIILGSLRYNLKNVLSIRRIGSIWIVTVLFGGLIEVLQYEFTRGRHGDWLDFIANTVGAAIAVLLWFLIQSRKAWLIERSKRKPNTKSHGIKEELEN